MQPDYFCCEGMRGALERAGERGLSVIAVADEHTGTLYLMLQWRGVDFADEAAIRDDHPAWPVTVNLSATAGMMFCPWCGRALAEIVAAHRDVYAALAQAHGRYRASFVGQGMMALVRSTDF